MSDNTLLLFGALALLFEDIAKGLIPAHVAAFVLRHMREHDVVQLENVPLGEWVSQKPEDQAEFHLELSLFCQDVHASRIDATEATNHIRAVHAHIDAARQRIMDADFQELGLQNPQLEFLGSNNIRNFNQLCALSVHGVIALRGERSHYFISTVLEWARSIPLVPTFAV